MERWGAPGCCKKPTGVRGPVKGRPKVGQRRHRRKRRYQMNRQSDSSEAAVTAPTPSKGVRRQADDVLRRRYHLQPADRQDIISQAALDYLKSPDQDRIPADRLFLAIVRRRACDFWRQKGREDELLLRGSSSEPMFEYSNLNSLQDIALRFFSTRTPLDRRRAGAILREILGGASFAEACRSARVPRGSQPRYRRLFQDCFRDSLRPPG